MSELQRYWVELDTFGGSLKLTAAPDGIYCLAEEVDTRLSFDESTRQRLLDDKRDHERFVDRVKRLMDAEMFDDARDEIEAEYKAIHGPSDRDL